MKRNRIWLGLLTVTMLFGSVSPAVVKGAEILEKSQMVETEEQTEFEIENGVLTKYNGPGGDVTIPDGVVGIGAYAFSEYYRDGRSRLVDWPFLCCLSGEWFSVEFVRVPMFPCR